MQCFSNGDCNYWLWISRNNWDKTRKLYKSEINNFESFRWKFIDVILYSGFWKDHRLDWRKSDGLYKVSKAVWDNFSFLDNIYIYIYIYQELIMDFIWKFELMEH